MDIINMRSYTDPMKFVTNNCKITINKLSSENAVDLELEDGSILIIDSFKSYIDLCSEGRIIKSRPIKDGVKLYVDLEELNKTEVTRDGIGNFTYKNKEVKEIIIYNIEAKIKRRITEFCLMRFII